MMWSFCPKNLGGSCLFACLVLNNTKLHTYLPTVKTENYLFKKQFIFAFFCKVCIVMGEGGNCPI